MLTAGSFLLPPLEACSADELAFLRHGGRYHAVRRRDVVQNAHVVEARLVKAVEVFAAQQRHASLQQRQDVEVVVAQQGHTSLQQRQDVEVFAAQQRHASLQQRQDVEVLAAQQRHASLQQRQDVEHPRTVTAGPHEQQ